MSTLGKKTVEDIDVKGKNVLVRCDFNVPMKDGAITNDNRIVAALPTIKKLIENGGRVILCSHLGKPKNGPEEKFSLAPVAVRLGEMLGKNVVFANDDTVVGENAKAAASAVGKDAEIVKVTDFAEIAAYGVMSTPGLVVDEKVVSTGKVLSAEEIGRLL